MLRSCVDKADNCSYICGEVTFASQKRRIRQICFALVSNNWVESNGGSLTFVTAPKWNFLEVEVNISNFRRRQQQFNGFFIMEGDLVPCNNVNGVIEALDTEYKSNSLYGEEKLLRKHSS